MKKTLLIFSLVLVSGLVEAADTKVSRKISSQIAQHPNTLFHITCAKSVEDLREELRYGKFELRSVSAPSQIGDKVCVSVQFKD